MTSTPTSRRLLLGGAAALGLLSALPSAWAQSGWPTRPAASWQRDTACAPRARWC